MERCGSGSAVAEPVSSATKQGRFPGGGFVLLDFKGKESPPLGNAVKDFRSRIRENSDFAFAFGSLTTSATGKNCPISGSKIRNGVALWDGNTFGRSIGAAVLPHAISPQRGNAMAAPASGLGLDAKSPDGFGPIGEMKKLHTDFRSRKFPRNGRSWMDVFIMWQRSAWSRFGNSFAKLAAAHDDPSG